MASLVAIHCPEFGGVKRPLGEKMALAVVVVRRMFVGCFQALAWIAWTAEDVHRM